VIETVLVAVQPLAPVPVTVYIVLVDGDTMAPLDKLPGVIVYVLAPVAVSVVLLPAHIVVADAVRFTVGFGSTVIATVLVAVQPLAPVPVTV
jgi:hypothetical protein